MTTCLGNCCSPGCRLWCLWWCRFCAVLFPTGCLGWGLKLNWVSFWGFSFLLLNLLNRFWGSYKMRNVGSSNSTSYKQMSSVSVKRFYDEPSLVCCLVRRESAGGFPLLRISVVLCDIPWVSRCHNTLFLSILISDSSWVVSEICSFSVLIHWWVTELPHGSNVLNHCRSRRREFEPIKI